MFNKLIKPDHIPVRAVVVTSLLAVSSANAADFVLQQMSFSDGSSYSAADLQGANVSRASHELSAQDAWLEQQLITSDGSSFSAGEFVRARGQTRVPRIRFASRDADGERETSNDVSSAFAGEAPDRNDIARQLRITDGTTE